MTNSISFAVDSDGIATLTIDQPDRSMNVIGPAFVGEFEAAIERAAADASVKGIIITSGKSSFVAGADLIAAPVNWPGYSWPEGERPAEVVKAQAAAAANGVFVAAVTCLTVGLILLGLMEERPLRGRRRTGDARVPAENRAMKSCNWAIFFSRCAFSDSIRERTEVLAITMSS